MVWKWAVVFAIMQRFIVQSKDVNKFFCRFTKINTLKTVEQSHCLTSCVWDLFVWEKHTFRICIRLVLSGWMSHSFNHLKNCVIYFRIDWYIKPPGLFARKRCNVDVFLNVHDIGSKILRLRNEDLVFLLLQA